MSELIKKRISESIGKVVLVFLKNNFRFEGKITGADKLYFEILDFRTNSYKIFAFGEIKEIEVRE